MSESNLPEFFTVRSRFESLPIPDVAAAVHAALDESSFARRARPGQRVAVAVGSRGIANLATIVAATVAYLKRCRTAPRVIPAMGSHGGATAAGQAAVLASLGVTEESVGCPIEPSMTTDVLSTLDRGDDDPLPIHGSRVARESDHVVIINRVKPHTRLVGGLQSGLCKMLMIGLGKRDGAEAYHRLFPTVDYRLETVARRVVPEILRTLPVTLGLAVVEDPFEQTSLIEAIEPGQFLTREPELLRLAEGRMPKLPFDRADLLIIDQIGKEISGSGMDTNVVGRKANDKAAAPDEWPKIRHIYVRDLSRQTAGNATGIGIAEFCHSRIVRQMDVDKTRINCLTSNHVTAAAVPVHYPTDREALGVALTQSLSPDPRRARWMWIPDTLRIAEVRCSSAYLAEADRRDDLTRIDEPQPLRFDPVGDLASTRDP